MANTNREWVGKNGDRHVSGLTHFGISVVTANVPFSKQVKNKFSPVWGTRPALYENHCLYTNATYWLINKEDRVWNPNCIPL